MEENIKENLEKLENNLDRFAKKAKVKFKNKISRENTLLLIIDIQERLAPAVKHEDKVIKNNNILLKMAKEMNIPVIITEQYPKGLGSTVEKIRENFPEDVKVFDKITFSAFDNKKIRNEIKDINKPNIIVTGMESHICVYQTVRDLQLKGYSTYTVLDAVSSRTEENFRNGLELMKDYGSRITNTETILYELLEKAGTDEFKKLSELIK